THNLKSINLNKLQRPTVHYWASVREIVKGEKDFSLVMTSPKTKFSAIINRTNLKIEINELTKEFPCIYSDDPQINQNELFFKSLKDIETTPANLANYFEPENNHTQLIAAFSRANKNLCSASLQFPSLKIPQILKRSKDAYMGAVDRKKNSLANILFFAEDDLGKKDFDDKVDIFTELLHRHKNLTWALLLRTPSEREFVAKLRKQLKSVDNFRIIDISDQQNFTSLNPLQYEDEPWQERSMLYTLSAVDAVFEVMTDFSISSINRARAIYGICCSSGIKLNLLNFSKAHEIKINLSVEFNELLRSGYRLFTLGEKNILKIDADILKTENLIIHDIDDLNTHNSSNIIKELLMNVKDFNIDSAEQWLRKNTNNYNSDKILAHLLSSLSN
nr:hypothetical protein [Pseudomonadota bacterium]